MRRFEFGMQRELFHKLAAKFLVIIRNQNLANLRHGWSYAFLPPRRRSDKFS